MKKSLVEANPASATKYMKRFLSPSNQERSPYSGKEVIIVLLSVSSYLSLPSPASSELRIRRIIIQSFC